MRVLASISSPSSLLRRITTGRPVAADVAPAADQEGEHRRRERPRQRARDRRAADREELARREGAREHDVHVEDAERARGAARVGLVVEDDHRGRGCQRGSRGWHSGAPRFSLLSKAVFHTSGFTAHKFGESDAPAVADLSFASRRHDAPSPRCSGAASRQRLRRQEEEEARLADASRTGRGGQTRDADTCGANTCSAGQRDGARPVLPQRPDW